MSSASASITLDTSGFSAAIEKAVGSLKGFAIQFELLKQTVKLAEWFGEASVKTIELSANLERMRNATGLSADTFLILQKALERGGISADEAAQNIQSVIASGQNLSVLFRDPSKFAEGLQGVSRNFIESAHLLSQNTKAALAVEQNLSEIRDSLSNSISGVIQQMTPAAAVATDKLREIDYSGLVDTMAKAAHNFADIVVGSILEGKVGEIVGKLIATTFLDTVNTFYRNITKVGSSVEKGMMSASSFISDAWQQSINAGKDLINKPQKTLVKWGFEALHSTMAVADSIPTGGGQLFDTKKMHQEFDSLISGIIKRMHDLEDSKKEETPAASPIVPHASDFHIIASSLAKVGGGGLFARVGMSTQEKLAQQTALATQAAVQVSKGIAEDVKAIKGKMNANPLLR
jgi:hypothetical protein